MNRVGREGRGESVWLGFFLHQILGALRPRSRGARRGRARGALAGRTARGSLRRSRTPGTATGTGAPTPTTARRSARAARRRVPHRRAAAGLGGADGRRLAASARRARWSRAEAQLVAFDDGMIRLLTPPFDQTPLDPGYIKGYVPGIRENGGQYTHGAMWLVRAMAELGWRERAAPLLERLTPGLARARRRAASPSTRSSPTSWPPTSTARRPTSGAAAGPGTRAARAGCCACWSSRSSASRLEGGTHAAPAALRARRLARLPGVADVEIEVRNPSGCSARVVACRVDGAPAPRGRRGARADPPRRRAAVRRPRPRSLETR